MATVAITLKSIVVPNYVLTERPRKEGGFQEEPKFAIKELSKETILELCDEFTTTMLTKGGYAP